MICKVCGKDKPLFSFAKIINYRRNKSGVRIRYEYKRAECKECYSSLIRKKYYNYVKIADRIKN